MRWAFYFFILPLSFTQDFTFFETRVRPLLAARCYACHSAKARIVQGGLRLDGREYMLKGGHSGPAVMPGQPDQSRLLEAVRHTSKPTMPPWGKLKDSEIATLEKWVRDGALWPEENAPAPSSASAPQAEDRERHWAWQPLKPSNRSIDAWIEERLASKGLKMQPRVDAAVLLRRMAFDLTGLPPSPALIQSFLADPSPEHYARIADQLLASPAFGERWGRHWLDVTYFGDTIDTAGGIPAPYAWRYRDYVVRSFNEDKPVDRFLAEQIAGDLLPAHDGFARREQISATGYLALGPWALVQADKEQLRMDMVDLQIDAIGRGMLGLTLACARCHDHKFDPVSQKEYFGMAGILASTRTLGGRYREDGVFSDVNKVELYESDEERRVRLSAASEYERALAEVRRQIAALEPKKSDKEIEAQWNRLRRREKMLEFNIPTPPMAYAASESDTPGNVRINIRGNAHQHGAEAPRTFIRVAMSGTPAPVLKGSGRAEMARWIIDPRNPLTARVYVNRVWQRLFGTGLVKSADNFGLRGDRPTHPELLDAMAAGFLADGWSTKRLIRRIVMTQAYQQSSSTHAAGVERDPANTLLWRANRRRLEAEAIRDSILAITGQLDFTRGGPTLPTDSLDTFSPDLGKVNPPRMNGNGRLTDRLRNRRTVYLPVYRGAQMKELDLLDLFDFANNAQVNATRSETLIPTQALYLLNSPWVREQAGVLARRLLEGETLLDPQRVERAILLIYNRPATTGEIQSALDFITGVEQSLGKEKGIEPLTEAWTRYLHALLASNEFLFRS